MLPTFYNITLKESPQYAILAILIAIPILYVLIKKIIKKHKKNNTIRIPFLVYCFIMVIIYLIIRHWDDFKLGISGG